jgi:serine/threonine-protein kinase
MPKSQAAGERAIELDDSLAEAWTAVAFTTFWYEWNWTLAEEQFRKALELDPGSAQTHAFYAHLLSNIGRHEEAIAEIKRARQIDPLDLLYNAIEGQILFFAGHSEESITTLQTVSMVNPEFWLAHLFISRAYMQKHMWPEAIASALKAKEIASGNSEAVGALATALAKSGRREEAENTIKELEERSRSRYVPAYVLAQVYLALGDRYRALQHLTDAYERKDALMVFLKVDPKWDELRSEPKFVTLIQKMKFE